MRKKKFPTTTPNYKVGYRRPPNHAQFRPGQSGNPSGRPSGRENTLSMLRRIAEEKVTIKENGKELQITKWEAVIRTLMARATKNDATCVIVLNLLAEFADEKEIQRHIFKVQFVDPQGQPMKELNERYNRGKG